MITFKKKRFEKRPLPDLDYSICGALIISEMSLEPNRSSSSSFSSAPCPSPSIQSPRTTTQPQSNVNVPKIAIPRLDTLSGKRTNSSSVPPDLARNGTLTRSSGAHLASALVSSHSNGRLNNSNSSESASNNSNINNSDILSKWIVNSSVKPQSELTIPYAVNLIAAHENLLFCMDTSSFLTIYEKVYAAELKTRNSLKLNIPNIRALACNSQYVAVAYSNLKKEQLKGALKNVNPSGIFLYRREQHVVCSVHEKQLELGKNECFKTINGLALTDKYAFVCEKETSIVYKFDLKSGQMIKSLELDGEPYSISANQSQFCVVDSANSYLYLFDNETLDTLSSAVVKSIDQLNGNMSILLTEENFVFIKNADNQMTLLNSKLEQCAYFNEMPGRLISISLVKDNNQMLVIACQNNNKHFKLLSYIG